jgi:preprotein translocase subunit SecD
MHVSGCLSAALLVIGISSPAPGQDKSTKPTKKRPDGVYAVLRDSTEEKEVLPLKDGEALVVNRHRYLKPGDKEPPRYLVVRTSPDVELELAGEPKVVEEGGDVVRVLLKLQPGPAKALELLTTDRVGKQVAVVIGGEVVTAHKVREAIKGGGVQITSCAPGGAKYLLKQLKGREKAK